MEAESGALTDEALKDGRLSASLSDLRKATTEYLALEELAHKIGVTRLAEATGLDRLGIPNFYAVRPSAKHPSAIISSGKGLDTRSASAGAVFEGIERFAAERFESGCVVGSTAHLREQYPECTLISPLLPESESLRWVKGLDLLRLRPCFVPLRCVQFPCKPMHAAELMLFASTNGLAAHRDPTLAMANALLELIERDATANLFPALASKLDWDMLPMARALARQFENASVRLSAYLVPSAIRVPVVYILSADDQWCLPQMHCSGAAASTDVESAAIAALLEVTQSRTSFIAMLREDCHVKVGELADDARRAAWQQQVQCWLQPQTEALSSNICFDTRPPDSIFSLISKLRNGIPGMELASVRIDDGCLPGAFAYRCYSPQLRMGLR